ncbi:MAG: hypothetical protein AAGH72_13550 [Verrucomicrobiota bacterium]
MKLTSAKSICLTLAAISLGQAGLLAGCGIDWSLPTFHFPDVNRHGILSYYEKIGEVEMGQNQIPIHIHFKSDRKSSSPYAGYGWTVPLLESRMVQVNENEFTMWQPEGRFRTFGRDSKNPNLLNGQGGWKAEIRGDIIHAYADCGWKLSFRNGRILSMGTPDGKSFRYDYQNGLVSRIRGQGGSGTVLEVIRDGYAEGVTKIKIGDQTIGLKLGEKPRIERINGQNLVGGIDQSLTSIIKNGAEDRVISYEVEPSNIVPTFQPSVGRKVTTQAGTGFVVSDGDWKYQIQPDEKHTWNSSAITRTNSKKENEFWHMDHSKGKKFVKSADGTIRTEQWFTSGLGKGYLRNITEGKGNKIREIYYNRIDEKGRIVRAKRNFYTDELTIEYKDENSKKKKAVKIGELEYQYGKADSITKVINNGIVALEFKPMAN